MGAICDCAEELPKIYHRLDDGGFITKMFYVINVLVFVSVEYHFLMQRPSSKGI